MIVIATAVAACADDDDASDSTESTDAPGTTPPSTEPGSDNTEATVPTESVPTTEGTTPTTIELACVENGPDAGSTTTTIGSTTERTDYRPCDIDAYITSIGAALDSSSGQECQDLPFVPGEVLVYISPATRVALTITQIAETITAALGPLAPQDVEIQLVADDFVTTFGGPVFQIILDPDDEISISAVTAANAEVQEAPIFAQVGMDNSTLEHIAFDVDHIGPFLPVGMYHPDDYPQPAPQPPAPVQASAASHSVLVVDSPPNVVDVWDESWDPDPANVGYGDSNTQVDLVAGHGPFVVDLIQQYAPSAHVELSPIVHLPLPVPNGSATPLPWPGFLFAEADLIRGIEAGLGAGPVEDTPSTMLPTRQFEKWFELINLSLGTFGCPNDTHPALAGALRDQLDSDIYNPELEVGERQTLYVAAAGNDGRVGQPGRMHFPAAFSDVDPDPNADVGSRVIAVGAGTETEPADYSNDACWVNAWAPGLAVAAFTWMNPTDRFAMWSGTSFAAARVTATLANSVADVDDTWAESELDPTNQIGGDPETHRALTTC